MAYSELIKNFDHIRSYLREFFVYGFKSRTEFDRKSARSYDNERRRMESWMGDYMSFRQDDSGKSVFFSVDSRTIAHNPLYAAFGAKSFTDNDLTLHFVLLDLLQEEEGLTVREITDRVVTKYLAQADPSQLPDESTIRKKLKEYEGLGLLTGEKRGRELVYQLRREGTEPEAWADAVAYFSEVDPMGVIGAYLLGRLPETPDVFRFKHHYLLHAMDSEILLQLLMAIREHRRVELTAIGRRDGKTRSKIVYPMRVYLSTQSGRQYLLAYNTWPQRPAFHRIDTITKVKPGEVETDAARYEVWYEKLAENLWGTSIGREPSLDHIEMTVHVEPDEGFILDRLDREKRCGYVEVLDGSTFKYVADVYDAGEMLPWLRTFLGRIEHLECSNRYVTETFWRDFAAMQAMYGR